MSRVLMMIPLTEVIFNLINIKLLYSGSDDSSSLLYMYKWSILEDIIIQYSREESKTDKIWTVKG